jgi:uncharacterized protein YheU (UPF0270 family)
MIIPLEQIDSVTLNRIIEAFVLREGTDYGDMSFSLAEKVEQVRQQLLTGEVVLTWSEQHNSINIVPRTQVVEA